MNDLVDPKDPKNNQFSDTTLPSSLILRPIIPNIYNNELKINFRSEIFYNSNAPNLENMGNRFIGRGLSTFNGLNISYFTKYFSFTAEPFLITSQNKKVNFSGRDGIFSRLNDLPINNNMPYKASGLRETQLYIHYNNFAVGYSNANMWWGPGFHNSLTMTNNTTGFPHLMIGTLNEKKFKNIGYNIRYIFSKLDKTIGDPYFTALI